MDATVNTSTSELPKALSEQPPVVPLLSIVCPTYNQVGFITQTIESFLAQKTNFPIEILINDDASTDGTTQIVEQYAARYPTIIRAFYHRVNQYSKGNLCTPGLFKEARGKYIAYCEGDDYWTDTRKLQVQVDFLESHPDYVLTYHDAMSFDSEGERGIQLLGNLRADATAVELQRAREISTLTTCFRNVFHELPPELWLAPLNDLCWWSLLGAHGKGKFLEEIKPAMYRIHLGGVFSMRSHQRKLHMSLQTCSSLANYYNRIGNQAMYEYFLIQVFSLSISAISPLHKLQALLLVARNISVNLSKRLMLSVRKGHVQ
ncbi:MULTISPECIES: glycosyltransferase family 2 protein [unclassified Pseudomonas]|uniref:glycosyltransferase family 2 protein n=1 Tax=unclassified Pseudomonas TaxID=196821 RepID=UPI00387E7877